MTAHVLAFDLGTGGCKAALVDGDGVVRATAFHPYPTTYPGPLLHEQRPEDWWDAVVRSCRSLLDGRDAEVAAIGLSGQSLALVPVAADRSLLRASVPIWSDARGGAQARRLFAEVAEDDWYARTGNGFPPDLYTAFKIGWLRDHEPELFARTALVLGSKDWVNLRLTGAVATDRSYASGSGVYRLASRAYDPELLAAAGLRADLLPPVVEPTEVVGRLLPDAARALGLPAGVGVVAGGVDNACMALGAGLDGPGRVYCSLGSSNWITVSAAEPVLDAVTRPFVFDHVVPDLYISALSTFGGGSSLAWLARILDAEDDLGALLDAAAARPIGARGLVCVPTLAGGTVLEGGPEVRGTFVGLDLGHERADLARAVVEGIALSLARAAEALGDRVALPDAVVAVGGGARGALLLGVLADALGRTVVRTSVEQDCAAVGAAALAAVGAGLRGDLAVSAAEVERVEPRAAAAARYRELAVVFAQVTEQLRASAPALAGVRAWAEED